LSFVEAEWVGACRGIGWVVYSRERERQIEGKRRKMER
jgi:hypothetical protein